MATAKAYDDWEDPGLAFTDEEIRQYTPEEWAAQRVETLCDIYVRIVRRCELDLGKPVWWEELKKRWWSMISWYCVAMKIQDVHAPSPPSARSAEGKKLTAEVTEWTEETFCAKAQSFSERSLHYAVTIGRRCASNRSVSGWKKEQEKASNRLANCLMRETGLVLKMHGELASRVEATS